MVLTGCYNVYKKNLLRKGFQIFEKNSKMIRDRAKLADKMFAYLNKKSMSQFFNAWKKDYR